MGKALIIAEKPSVAGDIAKALGGFKKDKDFFENDEYVVSSAVGHLLELAVPEEYEIARGKWSFDKLPHIPPRFALKPIEKSESRLKVLQKLIEASKIIDDIYWIQVAEENPKVRAELEAAAATSPRPMR